jgi:tetratricopeptide (TPR) repeat protein
VQRIVKEPSAQLLSITAQVFFDASQRNGRSVQRDFLDEAIRACTAALDKLRHLDLDPRQRPLAVICHLEIAVCHYLLDNPQAALAEIDASLRLDPNDEVARTMRGLLNRGSNWQAAIQDFRRAIQSQASSVWPYFYVAYESLSTGDYQGCLEACSAALPLSPDASVAASLNEWTAICLAELGAPSELVESYFQTALDFRPHHRRVVANLERFRASHRIGPSAPSSWMVCQDVEPTTAADRYVRTWPKRMPAPVAVG